MSFRSATGSSASTEVTIWLEFKCKSKLLNAMLAAQALLSAYISCKKKERESVCGTPDLLTGKAKTHLTLVTCLIEEARTSAPAKLFASCIYLL